MDKESIITATKKFLHSLKQLNDQDLTPDSALISSGIIDSISTLTLVDFLENTFQIEFQPHDVDQENLNSLSKIADFVLRKKG